jgi:hypothetical protein
MPDPKTVGEVIKSVQQLELKHEVLLEVQRFLEQFISTDTHQPKTGIGSSTGSHEVVPESVIQEVKDEIEVMGIEIKHQAVTLEARPVSKGKGKVPTKPKKPPRRKKSGKKTKAKGRKK